MLTQYNKISINFDKNKWYEYLSNHCNKHNNINDFIRAGKFQRDDDFISVFVKNNIQFFILYSTIQYA